LIIELIQGVIIIYRTAEFLDVLANTMGVITMATLIYIKKELIVKNL
jgi:glycopeptide antibiotics resistance protein